MYHGFLFDLVFNLAADIVLIAGWFIWRLYHVISVSASPRRSKFVDLTVFCPAVARHTHWEKVETEIKTKIERQIAESREAHTACCYT